MGYWKDLYGQRSDEFIEGVIAGIKAFAVWKNGIEYVGSLSKTLDVAIEEVLREFNVEID